jgi:hypothetical protein
MEYPPLGGKFAQKKQVNFMVKIKLIKLMKSGIHIAEYLTELPP